MRWMTMGLAGLASVTVSVCAADRPQWGEAWTRNMVSPETGLPAAFHPETGSNVLWSADLGTATYGTPVVAGGRVLVGTNNNQPRDERRPGDRGVLMCFDERDGRFLWQLAVPKLHEDKFLDWPNAGLCSSPTVVGRTVYVVNNRCELLALDLDGMADGNDGPFTDEGRLLSEDDGPVAEAGPMDADILWVTDLKTTPGIWPHDSAHASIVHDDGILYLNSGNGVDNTHKAIRRPDAPTLVAFDAATGRLLANDGERIGPRIVHCQWSSPALAEFGGRRALILAGADAVIYAFDPLAGRSDADAPPAILPCLWRFDLDPGTVKDNACEWNGRREAGGPSTIYAMPVVTGGRMYVTVGGDRWWGKREARLVCLEPADGGAKERWSVNLDQHCMSTPAVADGMVFIADIGKTLRCVDADTGDVLWSHDLGAPVSGSPLVADGKVYIGTQRGMLFCFAADRTFRLLGETKLEGPMWGSPVAANGTLFIASARTLYAVRARD